MLAPIQFGVGTPAGCEQAVHRLQHQLTRTQPYQMAGIAVDFKNAFNERKRNDIIKELYKYKELKPIWRIVDWAYSDSSQLWIRDLEQEQLMIQPIGLNSYEGVKQGDPLGSLLFALSMKSIYDAAVQSDCTLNTSAIAYLDDCTLVGLPDMRLINSFKILKEKALAGGLEINTSKTKFLWLHDQNPLSIPIEVSNALKELKIEIEYGATMILGAPIGTDKEKMKQLAIKSVKDQERFFELIRSNKMPDQEALLLIRMCGVPRFNYLSRTTHPSILLPAAIEFDQLLYSTFYKKFKLPIPDNYTTSKSHKQLTLPTRLAGLGLRSAVDTLDVAYIASIVRIVYEDKKWWKENQPTEANNLSVYLQWNETIDRIKIKLPGKKHKQLFPSDSNITTFIEQVEKRKKEEQLSEKKKNSKYTGHLGQTDRSFKKLQSELSKAISKLELDKLIKGHTDEIDINRLERLTHPSSNSHIWLSVIPTDNTLIMNNEVMEQSIRYRLGLSPHNTMPSECICGIEKAFTKSPYHAFSCRLLRSHATIFRHNLILHHLAIWTKRAGLMTEVEVGQLSDENRIRPDMVITNGNEMRIVDVTVVDPLNKTNINRSKAVLSGAIKPTTDTIATDLNTDRT